MALVVVLHKILCIIEINECLVAKILLTNVTKMNKHSNVTRFVHALMCMYVCMYVCTYVRTYALYAICVQYIHVCIYSKFQGHSASVECVAFDGHMVISGGDEGYVM